jgi:hypothetical protein
MSEEVRFVEVENLNTLVLPMLVTESDETTAIAIDNTWGDWDNIPDPAKKLWGKLDWNRSNWSSGGARTEELRWEELHEEQQSAAAGLGFCPESWANEQGGPGA